MTSEKWFGCIVDLGQYVNDLHFKSKYDHKWGKIYSKASIWGKKKEKFLYN